MIYQLDGMLAKVVNGWWEVKTPLKGGMWMRYKEWADFKRSMGVRHGSTSRSIK